LAPRRPRTRTTAWPYIYLFFRNQDEAKRVGVREDFLTAIAGAIPELDVPQWRDYLNSESGAGGQIPDRLAGYEKLGADLSIRAQPAAIVNGPNGTRTLQDSPTTVADHERDRGGALSDCRRPFGL